MKILQVTHFGTTTNYGCILQIYALQKAFKACGVDPILLRTDFSYQNKIKRWYASPPLKIPTPTTPHIQHRPQTDIFR